MLEEILGRSITNAHLYILILYWIIQYMKIILYVLLFLKNTMYNYKLKTLERTSKIFQERRVYLYNNVSKIKKSINSFIACICEREMGV